MTTRRLSYEYVKKVFEDRGCILLSTEYKNNTLPLKYICSCGYKTTTRFTNFSRGHKCKNCRSKAVSSSRRFTLEQVREIFEKGGCKLVSKEYLGSSEPLDYICECGRKSTILLGNFQKGTRCRHCGYDKLRGDKHYNWNPSKDKDSRNTPEYRKWRKEVLERDEYICQKCGETYWSMTAHHVFNYKDNEESRYDVDNGTTLCRPCHTDFHNQYGYEGNNGDQFICFMTDTDKSHPWYAGEVFND